MKKMLLFAPVLLVVFAVAVPASAQNRHYGNRGGYGYYGDGYHGTAVERSVHQTQGLVNGLFGEMGYGYGDYGYRGRYDYGYDYGYGYRYDRRGRHDSRNFLLGAAVGVGGALLIDKLSHRDDNGGSAEEPSKCFERIVKAAKKQRVPVDTAQAMAFCNGQPLPQRAPAQVSEREAMDPEQDIAPEPEGFTPAPASASHAYRGAYRENGRLCNDFDRPLTVLIDGQVVGTLAPGAFVTLSRLPAGQLTYRY